MIPQEQLHKLKPLPDIVKRIKAIKRKQNRNAPRKLHLTRRQRCFAFYPAMHQKPGYTGAHNYRRKS